MIKRGAIGRKAGPLVMLTGGRPVSAQPRHAGARCARIILLGIVHRAEPDRAIRRHRRIVEAIAGSRLWRA
jgi:hypothetical protein